MVDYLVDWIVATLQAALFVVTAPLFVSWIRRCQCLLQNRTPPNLWQPYRDLWKLFRKEAVVAEQASWVFYVTPYIVFGTTALAAGVVPLIATNLPTAAIADVIVLVGFFALTRFFLALAGMDIGTAFGGMGSSREMLLSSLTEPAMLMGIFTLSMTVATTNLSTTVEMVLAQGLVLRPSFVFALVGLMMVAVAETGRIPIDNPTTHLELTMVHEAMILEYSGRHLAMLEWAQQIKLMVYGVLIANLFFPWGIATQLSVAALSIATLVISAKLALLGAILALSETLMVKLRLFRAPAYLTFAFLLCLLGMLSHVIIEVG
ncbi:MAG: formate hydrogenlyase [Beggiatoa sp. IS2]|nr:MAG: formate hydrogenlyase [Beggiatoa sp. IS2]